MTPTRFYKTGFFSLLAWPLLALLALSAASCSNSTETRYVEVDPPPSDGSSAVTYTIKEASRILHYQQKIMTDDDGNEYVTLKGEGFELVHKDDKSASPVPVKTEFKALAKNFLGFSYSFAIQKDKTVYLYYTRDTIEYSFYKGDQAKLELLGKVSGTHGFTCAPPNVTIDGKVVTKWKDSKGAALPEKFMSKNDAFFSSGTGIGTKARPTAVGDIIFCDGTAATIAEVDMAIKSGAPIFEEYKKNAMAAIVFDRYNAATGSASGGDKIIGVGIQALNNAPRSGQESYKSQFKKVWRDNNRPNPYRSVYICPSYHGFYDLCDLKNLFGPFDDTAFSRDWTAIYRAVKYGDTLKAGGDMDVADKMMEDWYLPNWQELALLLAANYKYKDTLNAACDALGIARVDSASDLFWVTASKVKADDSHVYAAFVNPANSYISFKPLMQDDNYSADYWKKQAHQGEGAAEKCQILPFREFK